MDGLILTRSVKEHKGKVIKWIETDDGDLNMCTQIRIRFEDGSTILLRPDWRGATCYISEYVDKPIVGMTKEPHGQDRQRHTERSA